MKSTVFLLFLIISIVISACVPQPATEPISDELPGAVKEAESAQDEAGDFVNESVVEEVIEAANPEELAQPDSCTDSRDCQFGRQCIDGDCLRVEDIYDTDCEVKCNFNGVVVETSDGETYELTRGRGAYTAAGALTWNLVPGPDYCPGDEVLVPIEIKKTLYEDLLNTQLIVVSPGETSEKITHPTIKWVDFTLKVVSVDESCQ